MGLKQGYKQTEIGVIPEDWDILPIAKIGTINGRVGWKGYTVKDLRSTGAYTIGAKHIDKQNRLDLSDPTFLSSEKFLESPEIMVYKDDILIVQRGTIGKIVLIENEIGDATINPSMLIFRVKYVEPNYAYYYLISEAGQKQILNDTSSTGVPMITQKQVLNFKIPIPQLSEQTAIANALSDMDALISQTEKLIEKKKAIKQGAMQELLKPKEGWVTKKLGDIGKTYGGLSGKSKVDFANGNAFYIPFMNVMSSPTINLNFFDSVYIRSGEKQNKAQIADLFFNGSSETPEEVGMCSVLTKQIDNLYLNSFCFGYRLNDTQTYNGLFLAYYFRSDFGRAAIFSLAQGATRYNLSKGNFLKMEIPIPEFQTQNEIAGCIADMDSELKKITIKLTKLKQQKQGMMQALLTGKIRLVS